MSKEEYDTTVATFITRFETLFRTKKASINLEITSILKSNQSTPIAEALSIATIIVARENPAEVESLVVPLAQVFESDEIQAIAITDGMDGPTQFHRLYKLQLGESIADGLRGTALHVPKHTTISRANPALATAVFSATVLKHKLLRINSPYHFVRQGLRLPESQSEEEGEAERQEVVSIGACIHFSILGAKNMMELWFNDTDEGQEAVVKALKGIKDKGVISYPSGSTLLEETITKSHPGTGGSKGCLG